MEIILKKELDRNQVVCTVLTGFMNFDNIHIYVLAVVHLLKGKN